jgi:hypothetical protein
MRIARPYLGYRGFATVLRGCVAHYAGYVRPDPPASGSPWHICATASDRSILVANHRRFVRRISRCEPPLARPPLARPAAHQARRSPGPPLTNDARRAECRSAGPIANGCRALHSIAWPRLTRPPLPVASAVFRATPAGPGLYRITVHSERGERDEYHATEITPRA